MTVEERSRVEGVAASSVMAHRVVEQSRALLRLGDGASVRGVALEFGTWPNTVTRWRDRFVEDRAGGNRADPCGPGPQARDSDEVVEAVVAETLTMVPDDGSSAWTTRSMAARHRIGNDAVAEIWRARHLRPWQIDTFKLSTDPDFEAELVDIVGLYNNPPERAAVFCFDEKTQVQALDRTQPSLKPGRAATTTHDYRRHGTVDLFAAMNPATGEVLHDLRARHTGADVSAFFKWIDLHVPSDLDVHVVLDNLSAHKSEPVRKWLERPRRGPMASALHPDLAIVAEPDRDLVLDPDPQGAGQHQLRLQTRPRRGHRHLDLVVERQPRTLHLDDQRPRHHHQGPPRTSRPQ